MNYQQRTDPRSCVWVVYIAGDTLCHQPMGAGHMTVLQLLGPMGSRVLPWWLFIAGDTLRHQPMRTGHMTVLQLRGLMEFCVLQWCHPMLASTRRTSCCTRIITLYGTQKWIQARTPILQGYPSIHIQPTCAQLHYSTSREFLHPECNSTCRRQRALRVLLLHPEGRKTFISESRKEILCIEGKEIF